ncbi:MAG: hypothetical protein KatS3mg126_0008 [Lysobacteraceae bacterium]|nr:MAG: hypothetical protein KatS3mg126_0008 [Xanthomonadaceae bacterium]
MSYGAASSWASGWAASATVSGAVSGFVGGAVASGSVKGGVQGAFSGAVLGGIGGQYGGRVTVGRVTASGLAGGVLADLQGGKFGHGFLSAGVAAASGPYVPQDDVVAGATVSAILGGSVSALTGGKFANGALTAAFSYAFSSAARKAALRGRRDVTDEVGGINAPTEELRADLAAVKSGGAGTGEAAKRLIAEGIKYFGVKLDPASVIFDARYRGGALAFANGTVLIGPSQFETFGLLGSTLIHEAVHIGGTHYSPESLGGLIQECQALSTELSRVGDTGVNAAAIE